MRMMRRGALANAGLLVPSPGGGLGWSPADFGSSLIGLFDATEPSTITLNSGNVASWSSGFGGAMSLSQATGSKQPGYASGVSVDFTGPNERWLSPSSGPTTDFIMLAICTLETGAISSANSLLVNNGRNCFTALSDGNAGYFDGSANRQFGFTLVEGQRTLVAGKYQSAAAPQAARDGNALVAGPNALILTSVAAVGGWNSGEFNYGPVNMFAFLTIGTSDADRQKMEGWMVWKLVDEGVVSAASDLLVSGHPYRSIRP